MSTSLAIKLMICLAVVLTTGCTARGASDTNTSRQRANASVSTDVKSHIASMWEGVDVSAMPPDSLEQRVVDYLYLMQHVEAEDRSELWKGFFKAMTHDVPSRTVCDYLGNCDSPLYDPKLLCEYLDKLMTSIGQNDPRYARVQYLRENVGKNLPGMTVADIPLKEARSGKSASLLKLFKGEGGNSYLLLYDPDCDVCAEVIATLPSQLKPGERSIAISVTPESKQMAETWQSYTVPGGEDVVDEYFYIDELPALYLLDPQGRVIGRKM